MELKPLVKCWVEGLKACEANQPRESNPYSSSETQTDQAVEWFGGWDTGKGVLGLGRDNSRARDAQTSQG